LPLIFVLAFALCPLPFALFAASDTQGRVIFTGLAVPGATVTASHGATKAATTSDDAGVFRFAGLADGVWTVRVEMRGFAPVERDVTIPVTDATAAQLTFTLTLQSYEETVGRAPNEAAPLTVAPQAPVTATAPPAKPDDTPDIINGSSINGAATRFAQPRAFGNNRPAFGAQYSGAFTANLGNSAWNAKPYLFGNSSAPSPSYGDAQLGFTLAGPLRIPWLITHGPQTSLSLQHNITHNATTQSALMPTLAERLGDLSQSLNQARDPLTGTPFPDNVIPLGRISPQAAALLGYYPLPNAITTTGANYQTPVVSSTTLDSVQVSTGKSLTNRTTAGLSFGYRRTETKSVSLFDFSDTTNQSTLNAAVNWSRRFGRSTQVRANYTFTRASSSSSPFFANRVNVSGDAGITGNSQNAADWGPPTLSFPDIAGLGDMQHQQSVIYTHAGTAETSLKRGRHNLTIGGDLKWNAVNVSSQPDPRGSLSFTGAATGNAFADFLLGLPATSSIAFGNTDARLRGLAYDAYINDDFRIGAGITMNVGVRWEYDAPFTEASGRLSNLDVTPGFTAAQPVTADNPMGVLTGIRYPSSLIRPDKRGFEPRIGAAWRPVLGSSLVIRATYGLYRNLGLYQSLGLLLAQQPPFSKSLSVQNTAQTPLTLANPFPSSLPSSNSFGIDPDFRAGYVHSVMVSAQRDLPASLTVIAAYFGDRGVHLAQALLPNTYPGGAADPCPPSLEELRRGSPELSGGGPTCPTGFVYVTSTGSSMRNAGQFTIRRRLYAGFTATVQYTIAKSTDDAATFSNNITRPTSLAIAQNWLDLGAERGPSSFDQRHLLSVQAQYSTGVGVTGGTLVDGFWGTLYKDWTITSQLTAGSGLPLTPISFSAVPGTGVVGVRPALTGVSTKPVVDGSYVNPAAFAVPASGTWGNAGRNSIRGPAQFALDATLARVFRLHGRLNLEWRIAATNVLNRVTFATINTVITSPQFGQPTLANQMRRIQTTFRLRF
jgi:hypothetical protein